MDTHKKILVIRATNLSTRWFNFRGIRDRDIQMASLVLIKTETHFKAVKNRWDAAERGDRIPNFLFQAFLLRYAHYFDTRDIQEALLD
jgi:hypothetical protein